MMVEVYEKRISWLGKSIVLGKYAKLLLKILRGTSDANIPFDDLRRLMLKMDRYEIIIYWSDEDQVFIAEVPELAGCIAHGDSQEGALKNARKAIQLWIETAKEFGDPIPTPKGRRLMLA